MPPSTEEPKNINGGGGGGNVCVWGGWGVVQHDTFLVHDFS